MKKKALAVLLSLVLILKLVPMSTLLASDSTSETLSNVLENDINIQGEIEVVPETDVALETSVADETDTVAETNNANETDTVAETNNTNETDIAKEDVTIETENKVIFDTFFDELIAAETVEELFVLMCQTEEHREDILALTEENLIELKANTMTLAYEDESIRNELLETIELLSKNSNELVDSAAYAWEGWIGMTDANYNGGTLQAGNYYLTEDIHINTEFQIGGNTVIDLNGYAIVQDEGQNNNNAALNSGGYKGNVHTRVMYIHGNANVTIQDSAPEREHKGTLVNISRWCSSNYTGTESQWVTTDNPEYWVYDGKGNTVIKGGIITGGFTVYGGAGISVQGNAKLTITGGTIVGNRNCTTAYTDSTGKGISTAFGGGIHVTHNSEVTLNGGSVIYNWSDGWGGGVSVSASEWAGHSEKQTPRFNFISGTIAENCGQSSGGGINVSSNGQMTLGSVDTIPVIRNNTTFDKYYTGNGGGIHIQDAALTYYSGYIQENYAGNCGGGIYCYVGGSINASGSNCIIEKNTANRGAGGGIFIQYGDVIMNGGIIRANKTNSTYAGGVGVRIGTLTMTGGEISDNESAGDGGGVWVTAQNNVTPHGDNGARGCGATLIGTKIHNNSCKGSGGGMFVSVANSTAELSVTVSGGSITNNTSPSRGGAICLEGGTLTVKDNPIISGNTAKDGGAFYVADKDRTNVNANDGNKPYKPNEKWGNSTNTSVYDGVDFIYDIKPGIFNIYSGTVNNNNATADGGLAYVTGKQSQANVYGGTYTENVATENGGAIAVAGGGNMSVSNGDFTSNTAIRGGAAYVSGGSLTILNGTFNKCIAQNGGAAYVTGGSVIMKNGKISECSADETGGGIYINGGSMTMSNGIVEHNMAKNGGAVYINNGNFIMESGIMQKNGTLTDTEYGGAVYVKGGNLTIGLQGCTQDVPVEAHQTPGFHPVVKDNTAKFGGGLAVNGGDLILYCCNVLSNISDNAGTGMNIFVEGGNFTQYLHGAAVGKEEEDNVDHGVVMVGGNMNIVGTDGVELIKINYHSNYGFDITWTPQAPEDYWLNLPYCPKEWSDEQAEFDRVFVGWGDHLGGTEAHSIRNIYDYYPIGHPIQIKDMKDKEGEVHLYAIWAPVANQINYAYSLNAVQLSPRQFDGTIIQTNVQDPIFGGQTMPTSYEFTRTTEQINVPTPSKPGYTFVRWIMYASPDKISNWNVDAYKIDENGNAVLDANNHPILDDKAPTELKILCNKDSGMVDRYAWPGKVQQNFGDITLVAVFTENDATINYQIVGVADGGTLTKITETIKMDTGNPTGTVVTANTGKKIAGWYLDEACTQEVIDGVENTGTAYTTESKLTPRKGADNLWHDVTYFAKIEYAIADLTITTKDLPTDFSYIFTISGTPSDGRKFDAMTIIIDGNGSKTIKSVPVGEYTVTEQNGWIWRHILNQDQAQNVTVDGSKKHEVIFDEYTTENTKWLDGNSYKAFRID